MAEEDLVVRFRIDNADALAKQAAVGAAFAQTTAKIDAGIKQVAASSKRSDQVQIDFAKLLQQSRQKSVDAQVAASRKGADRQIEHMKSVAKEAARTDKLLEEAGKKFGQGSGIKQSAAAGNALFESLRNVAGQAVGIGIAGDAVKAMKDEMDSARKYADDLAKDFIRQRDSLREIASITGKSANKDLTIGMAKFGASTGLNAHEAKDFTTEFLNSGMQNIGAGKSLSQSEGDRYRTITGSLAAAKGIDTGVIGKLAGSALGLENFSGKGQGADQAATRLNRSLEVLGRGQGDNNVLARQLQMLAASTVNDDAMRGIFRNSEEAAIAVSVGAEKHDAQASELTQMAARGLYSGKGKEAETLAAAGIDHMDSFFERVKKLSDYVDRAGAGQRPQEFLEDKFGDIGTREALAVFMNRGIKGGVIADRMAALGQMNDPGQVNRLVADFQSNPEGAGPQRMADAAKALAETRRGAERADLATLRTQAEGALAGSKADQGYLYQAMSAVSALGRNLPIVGGFVPDPKEELIRRGMTGIIDRRAMSAGLPPLASMSQMPGSGYLPTYADQDRGMISSMDSMKAAGVNPLVDLMRENNRLIAENNRLMQAQRGGGQPAPLVLPGRPSGPIR